MNVRRLSQIYPWCRGVSALGDGVIYTDLTAIYLRTRSPLLRLAS